MRDLVMQALDTARQRGADYADARVVDIRSESVSVRNRNVEALSSDESVGFGVRVIVDGYWGFAGSHRMTAAEADVVADRAIRVAKASSRVRGPRADIGPPQAASGEYRTPVAIDPFSISLDDKIELLLQVNEAMMAAPNIVSAEGDLYCQREEKTFGNSEGAFTHQVLFETGCGIEATAVDEGEVQNRSYPNSVGRHQGTEGWEFVTRYDLPGNAARVADEATQLLRARPMEPGVTTVILDGTQVALQIHESCGHPIELDRVLGTEAAFAGTSFLTTDKLGWFKYGSPVVNITADATIAGGLGTFGFDDEGVPAQSTPIVRDGVFVGYLTSREAAAALNGRSQGAMRASGWNRIPLIRMTNVSLEPGTWTLDDMIADTDDGVYMETNRSWSIDDKRLNFQFGTEIGREIKNGKLGALIKNPTYTGITPVFWGSCDAIGDKDSWVVWGTPNCGKGQPEQVAHTGHGASPARFRNVQVGLMK